MEQIRFSQLPDYLVKSELYKNYKENNDFILEDIKDKNPYLSEEEINILLLEEEQKQENLIYAKIFLNDKITCFQDLRKVIEVIDYWMIDDFPEFFYGFLFRNKMSSEFKNDIMINHENLYKYRLNKIFEAVKHYNNTHEYNGVNDIGFLKYLINYKTIFNKNDIVYEIVKNGSLECLQYVYENGYKITERIFYIAILYNHFDCLKYLIENKILMWENWGDLTNTAASKGNIKILRYLIENGCRWDYDTAENAAIGGNLECLEFAHKSGKCKWGSKLILEKAIEYGNLECLKYAHENGCPWDEWTPKYAAQYGHLECLKYLHENGCPWNYSTIILSVKKGHLNCLEYAYEKKCPHDKEEIFLNAVKHGHLECLKFLHKKGYEMTKKLVNIAARYNHLECLKYLIENDCSWEGSAINLATTYEHEECLKYLNFKRFEDINLPYFKII